eukprot:TRINITY_DN12091_c0_g1_i1.p1 TRINITY_DN12091_c0_g1~~TRINITY_DN12091_c0_g1_i1.p1  ORF type:complete len:174 (-),score=9.79 TRINITY_DN12091_c0_g1_i1:55-522(-)
MNNSTTHIFRFSPDRSFIEEAKEFLSAVEWTEPWLLGLIIFHLSWFSFILLTRKVPSVQIAAFLATLFFTFMSETLNGFGRRYWSFFSNTNYFDKRGLFISVVYGFPLLIVSLVALVNILIEVCNMMVVVKRAEMRSKLKQQKESKLEQQKEKNE